MRRNAFKCDGQITVFILLVFMLIASLLAAQYRSALFYAIQSDAMQAANLSVDSFLASYQKPLKEFYGLLTVDGGYGQKRFALDMIEEELLQVFNNNLKSSMIKSQIKGCVLAEQPIFTYFIDDNWDFLIREIRLTSQESIQIEGLDYILEHWKSQKDSAQEEFTYQKQVAENTNVENEQNTQDEMVQEVKDPRDLIMMIWNQGILKAACPKDFRISEKNVQMNDVSYPENSESVGTFIDLKNDASIQSLFGNWESILQPKRYVRMLTDDIAVQNYIKDKFGNAIRSKEMTDNLQTALQYEIEYIIGGHESDSENLKTVLWKLLAIRCIFNLSYLLSSSQKGSQVMVTATVLSTAFMLPHFTEVVAFALKLSWAFAEALADCRTLLNDGKIPLVKNDDTWYLEWNDFLNLYEDRLDGNQSQEGIDYGTYLQILLAFTEKDAKYRRMTHLMEKNIRQLPEYDGFKMKNCVYGIQAVFGCNLDKFGFYRFQTALSY